MSINGGDYVQVVIAQDYVLEHGEYDGCEGKVAKVTYTGTTYMATVDIESASRRGRRVMPVSILRRL